MNIFDLAMDLEKEGEKYYREIAAGADNAGYKKIFNMLADDEVKHLNVVSGMKERYKEKWSDTKILDAAKKTFMDFVREGDPFKEESKQKELYEKALDIERRSRDFYLEKAEEVSDAFQKDILKRIAKEEEKHSILIEQLLKFIKEPETFLENAEFFQQEDYWMLVS